MEIYYLYHSGFAVLLERRCFIFDYYIDTPRGCGLDKGVIRPEELQDREVYVFVSHRHPDHYNHKIFSWRKEIPNIHYILSDDIKTTEDVYFLHGGQSREINGLRLHALTSTDAGVAFLIKTDSTCIYHAGDLNWWHWEGEPERDNLDMEKRYKQQIDTLKEETIDLAFVPVDPRLENQYLWGLDYLMRTADVRHAVPMHFGDDTSIFERLKTDRQAEPYRDKILPLCKRGQRIRVE